MREVTASSDHASDTDNGPDESIGLTTDAEGTPDADEMTATSTRLGDWLPTMSVAAPEAGPRWGLWGGALGVVVLLAVAGAMMATRLPGGTTLAGAEVASAADAPPVLADADAALANLQIAFVTEVGTRVTTSGADLGLAVDDHASQAPLRNGVPALTAWLRRLPDGPLAAPVVAAALPPATLADVAEQVSTDPVNADVQVTRAGVDVTPGEDGVQAGASDVDAALSRALATIATSPADAWPATLEVPVTGTVLPPPVTQDDIDQIAAVIDRVEAAEVGLTARTTVPPEEDSGGSAVSEERIDNRIVLTGAELRTLVDVEAVPDAPPGERLQLVPNIDAPPSRIVALLELARVPPVMTARIENRSPTPGPNDDLIDVSEITGDIVAGETTSAGFEPDREATLADIIDAALAGGGEVRVTGTEDLSPTPEDMGILEPISTFTTFFPAGQSRVQNIHRIADIVDGTIIPAGQSYELNHAVGRRTRENGFTVGGAIIDGELVSDLGGGVSQFATTFFNAAWFAGVELVEWKAHSIYFPRYPAGREATINYPNVNLEIRNDTPYAILIDTAYTPSSVTVTFWSTPYWEVETIPGPCACGGSFRMDVDRIRTSPDGAPIQESWSTVYTVPRPSSG